MSIYDTKGRIFNIQRYSIHDGPGIRTIVFFKGCYLRCKWCCNPESQNYNIEQMNENGTLKTVGKDVTVSEILPELLADSSYFRRSGGGITLSGGECLGQIDFARDLLCALKNYGIHTAIESTACTSYSEIEKILPYLDTFLMDIKHIDSQKHKQFTTMGNELILENAKKLAKSGVELIIRTPVVPTFNDTEQEIYDIALFASSLQGVKEYHLLPYHRLGQDKYGKLGREYTMSHILPPQDEKMEKLLESALKSGLKCQIGG